MGKHLTVYGAGTLNTNQRSYHSFEYYGEDSPERQAQIAIEGETKLLNPWHLIWQSSPGGIVQSGTLEITLADPWDFDDDEEMGVLWDNTKLVSKLMVREGETYTVKIPQVNGEVLQVWLSDSNGANVRFITDAKEAQKVEEEIAAKRKKDFTDTLSDVGSGVQESTSNLKWTIGGLAIIALAGAAVYFSMKK